MQQHIIIIPPHIIIMGMPIFIMAFIWSQHFCIISAVMLAIGAILQTISPPTISQVIFAIIGIIIGIIDICGIMPPMFIIGITFVIVFSNMLNAPSIRGACERFRFILLNYQGKPWAKAHFAPR